MAPQCNRMLKYNNRSIKCPIVRTLSLNIKVLPVRAIKSMCVWAANYISTHIEPLHYRTWEASFTLLRFTHRYTWIGRCGDLQNQYASGDHDNCSPCREPNHGLPVHAQSLHRLTRTIPDHQSSIHLSIHTHIGVTRISFLWVGGSRFPKEGSENKLKNLHLNRLRLFSLIPTDT
jgi:hypothetical protein